MTQPKLFTIGEAAARIGAASKLKPEYVARQIRTLVQRQLVLPAQRHGSGQTAAAMLGEVGLAEARVHCWLMERGFAIPTDNDKNVFTEAHSALTTWRIDDPPHKGESLKEFRKRTANNPVALAQAIDGIRRGEFWVLALTFYRSDRNGQRWVQASVFEQSEGYAKNKPDAPAEFTPEGLQFVYLTPLLLPLVADRSGLN